MLTPDTTERRVGVSLIALCAVLTVVALGYYLFTEGLGYKTIYILISAVSTLGLLALYQRGHAWARQLALVMLIILVAAYLPEPFASQDFSMAIYLPAVFALIISDARWVLGTAVATWALLIVRGGAGSIYLEPGGLIISTMIVGGMALARQLTDAARARTEQQAGLLREERELLERRVAERTRELATTNAELREAGTARDFFLAGVSHELRTPLNIILGNLELLREGIYGPVEPRQLRALNTIDESGQHLLQLINDLLDIARLESGTFTIERDTVSVSELCTQCARLIRTEVERKGLTFQLDLDPGTAFVQGDPQRLRQILLNLLSNAVKFTPEGGRVTLATYAADLGQMVEFVVTDTGIGIADDQLGKLFRPFSQVDRRLARKYEGTGLGLALVAQLANLHGGAVGVTSVEGEGSRFWVRLPAAAV